MNGFNGGNSMNIGGGNTYSDRDRDGSRTASPACGLFDALTWRI